MEQVKKILVLGCKGMAGHVVKAYLESTNNYDVWGIARGGEPEQNLINLNVSETKELESIFDKGSFDVVINCIGLLNKTAEDNPELAIWFNSYFPHFLASLGSKYNFKLIHISTDCVFSGKEGGYTENDFKNGIGFYAQSKSLGEIINNKDTTIRTSIIGPELKQNGIGLFHWFMSHSEYSHLKGFTNAFWSGLTTLELAKVIIEIINQKITGLIQVAPDSKIDKFNLISLFNLLYRNKKIFIERDDSYYVDKSLVSIRTDFKYQVPNYREMLESQKEWILNHPSFYSHYYKNIL